MTGWVPTPRSAAAAQLYAAAEMDRAANPDRYRLGADTADAVIEKAARGGSLTGFGDPTEWRTGLEHYLESAQHDGRLNALGARMVRNTAVGRLRARAEIDRHFGGFPETACRRLTPPIVVIGGWRTGTTYLFRLLATDARLRAPLPVELATPWATARLDQTERDALLDAGQAEHDMLHLLTPDMAIVHNSGPRLPEECVLGMGTTMRNWGFTSTTRLESYATWLADQDFAGEYTRHRQILQMLDDSDGRRWVVKAPAHTAELEHLAATYPGSCIVWLHRDIVEMIASGASLFATYRSTYSDAVNRHDVGRFQTDQTELWLRRAVAFRATSAAKTVTFVDIAYTDLVSNPEAVLDRIYAAADLESIGTSDLIERFRRAQSRDQRSRHRYLPEQFGIDPDALHERMAFYTRAMAVNTGISR